MRTRSADILRYAWQLVTDVRVRAEQQIAERRQEDIAPYLGTGSLRILDLANGQLRPQYALLKAAGHQVVGIDLVNGARLGLQALAYEVGRLLYIQRLGLPGRAAGPGALVYGDVHRLPFAAASFDLVTSVAAFEHFSDPPRVLAEIGRVLRPGGIVWASIHLFTSLSGGHNLSKTEIPLRRMPRGAEPWDHLRSRALPVDVTLNEWRRDQYLDAVGRHFQILNHYCALKEGEQFLTPALERELASYGRDELTSAAYVIVARKPPLDAG